MRRLLGIFVVLIAATLGASSAQAPPQRIALVIGNANYQVPAWKLANPVRDAELMYQRLTALGFSVDLVRDATRAQMDAAFQRYGTKLQAAGRNAVSVVFYAGHGAENDGANYLVPTDANIRTKDQLRYQAPPAQFLLDYMARAGNAVNILILDACRDMPLPDGNRSLGRGGLAEIPERPNVLIAYSTAPNTTAPDGDGANSPFTAALAAALASDPGDPVSLLFEDVQTRVHPVGRGAAPALHQRAGRGALELRDGAALAAGCCAAGASANRTGCAHGDDCAGAARLGARAGDGADRGRAVPDGFATGRDRALQRRDAALGQCAKLLRRQIRGDIRRMGCVPEGPRLQ
jgi:Caspase domain